MAIRRASAAVANGKTGRAPGGKRRATRSAAAPTHAKAEQALRESEERFRSLTELSSDWYWEQDAELRFVATMGTTEARGGISPESHIGKQRWELPNTEIIGQTWEEHRALLDTRQPFYDLLLKRGDAGNEFRYVSVSGRPI